MASPLDLIVVGGGPAGMMAGLLFARAGCTVEVLEKHEGHTVAFSHWSETPEQPDDYHIVRYELDDEDDATHVTLTQTNVGDRPDIDAKTKAEFDKNWDTMLKHLKKAAEAG